MRRVTHREYLATIAWMQKELNIPSRSDYYLMQIAREIRRTIVKDPNGVKLRDMLLEFTDPTATAKPISPELRQKQIDLSKALWFQRTGFKKFQKKKDNG